MSPTTNPKTAWPTTCFPLPPRSKRNYKFRLIDQEPFEGRQSYHIAFTPIDDDDTDWAGEAYIDAQEFQPIYVFTKLSRPLPFGVRKFMGIDLPGLGFAVHYRRQEDGVWFPTSLGSEFRIRVFFVFNRTMTVSLENKAFEHTHVESKIVGADHSLGQWRTGVLARLAAARARPLAPTSPSSRILLSLQSDKGAIMASLPEGFAELKQRLRASWMAGDFGEIAKLNAHGAEDFIERLHLKPGTKVLDVACGTGNQSIPAARAGAEVIGLDIATNLLEQARQRAAAKN